MTFVTKYSPEQSAEARRLRAEGLTFAAIAERVGFAGSNTVSAHFHKKDWKDADGTVAAAVRRRGPKLSPATPRSAGPWRCVSTVCRAQDQDDGVAHEEAVGRLRSSRRNGTEPPAVTKDERESFAALIEQINQVTEMASEPASAADGRRKSAVNPELTALSDDIDPDGLAVASEKDQFRRRTCGASWKAVPPA